MDIGGWLRGLGLERYEQAFCENEIDEEVLPGLTADDLKDLGVALVGRLDLAQWHWHRRRCGAVRRRRSGEPVHAGFVEPGIRDFKLARVVGHGVAHRRF